MDKQNASVRLTLGSLFDGIGGFPYAGSFFGIEPLWASEILPIAISVTKRNLPHMEHVGDITKLHGGKLPPVDIVTFGSPCQGLSAAGKRKGFSDPRSGLFSEAIRIIEEMREATNGKYPTWAVWENVPGALSSNGGLDFRAVLEAFTGSEIPVPQSSRWANAGMVRGGGADIAWCVYNAQHFGTAQRRRRIFLVADFGGERSGEILFVPKSLRGYFEAGGTPRQGTAAYTPRSVDGTVANRDARNCLNPWDTQQTRVFTDDGTSPTLSGADGGGGRNPGGLVFAAFSGGAGEKARSIGYSEKVSPTLKHGACGFNAPCLCEPARDPLLLDNGAIPIHDKATRFKGGGDTRRNDGSGNGLGVGKSGDPAPTITAGDRHAVAAVDCRNYKEVGDISGTLQAKNTAGYSLNYQNPVRTGYIVRRLTPTECERLQGYPDGWTALTHDGKPVSDSSRYMMLGNSVAVPCVAYILLGIRQAVSNG